MSWIAAAVIGSSIVGGYASNKAAKQTRKGQQYAADRQMEGFEFYKPYLEDVIDQGQDALADQLSQGAYQGQTYAGMDNLTRGGLNYAATSADQLSGVPLNLLGATGGFVNNYGDLYNRAADFGSDGTYNASALGQATAYGTESPQAQAMVDNIMRDETRRLFEGTLPRLEQQAVATGNTNSSKAAVADAIARRGYRDRRADVAADVADKLSGRFLNQYNADMRAATGLTDAQGNVFNNAFAMIPQISQLQTSAGDRFQRDRQAALDDARMRFELDRDYRMDKLNEFNAGILNQAVRNSPQNPVQVTTDPNAAGIGGAMAGAGFGLEMYKTIKDLKAGN